MPRFTRFLSLFLLLALLGACASSNAVKLTYVLGVDRPACPGKVVIYKFEDKRPAARLGKDDSGHAVETLSSVVDWVGWALFDELASAGCDVKYRTSTPPEDGTPVVTGEVLNVGLNQTGTTTWTGAVEIRIIVKRDGKIVHTERFAGEVQDVVLPGYGTKSEIMAATLRTLMAEVVPAVCRQL